MSDESGKPAGKERNKGGRPRGSLNKTSATAKENVIAVFNRLKGTAWMEAWAKKNPNEYFRLYAKLIPAAVEVDATVDASVTVEIKRFTPDDTGSK